MSNKGYNKVPLGDVLKEVYRYPTYYGIDYTAQGVLEIRGEFLNSNGSISVVNPRYISNETNSRFPKTQLEKDDIVMSVRGTLGKVGIITDDLAGANITANLLRLSPDKDLISGKYLLYYFLSSAFNNSLENASESTTIKTIKVPELKSIKIPLPSLKEQRKIAEILSSVDAAIEKTEQVIAKTEEVKKGLMQQLLTRGIDQKKFKDSPVGQIPIIWNVERLGSEAYIKARIGWKGLSSEEYTDEGPYLIAGKHILRTNILWEKCDHISMERYEESPEIMLRNDDVIMTKDGTIGRVAHIESLNDKATINGTMMLIRPLENLEGKFIYYYFQSTRFQRLIKEKVSGSSIPHIFQRDLVEFKIPVPPLNEQRKIVEILSNIDKKIEREYEVLEYISNLKKGLMQQLLTGQIRVKVD